MKRNVGQNCIRQRSVIRVEIGIKSDKVDVLRIEFFPNPFVPKFSYKKKMCRIRKKNTSHHKLTHPIPRICCQFLKKITIKPYIPAVYKRVVRLYG